jgi:lipopolysaccharide export system protein LptA
MQKFVYVLVLLTAVACTKKAAVSKTEPVNPPAVTAVAATPAAAPSTAALEGYAGSFKMESNEYVQKVNVVLKDGSLALAADTGDTAPLKASGKADVFTANIQGYDAEISFSRTGGNVSNIKISVGGGALVLNGTKEN